MLFADKPVYAISCTSLSKLSANNTVIFFQSWIFILNVVNEHSSTLRTWKWRHRTGTRWTRWWWTWWTGGRWTLRTWPGGVVDMHRRQVNVENMTRGLVDKHRRQEAVEIMARGWWTCTGGRRTLRTWPGGLWTSTGGRRTWRTGSYIAVLIRNPINFFLYS